MAKTLANYDPLVQIPSGMTPAGADFPIVESHDILVGENDKRLDAKLDDIDSAIGNVGETPIATQLSSKVNTGDIVTSVAATGSTSNNKIPSETAVRAAIEAKTINVDSTVTEGSTNAVSGGAVHAQLATKQDVLTFDTTPTASSSNPVTSGGVKAALDTQLATKQDALTFDTTPTASSNNPVTSGGVKTALDGKQNVLTYETTPVVGSVNPVTSTGIRNAIDAAAASNLGDMRAQYAEFVADADDILEHAKSLSNGMVACSDISAETTVGDTRILLYTGTTNSKYTNGHWYYNSAPSNAAPSWTDGGAVGSAPTIDNTLTVEGAAANSKSVGDAIENIVTISNTQPGANSGNKVWIKETTNEEVQVPTYEEHISKANKADITTNNESDNGSGTITASKAYAIGDHFYINNTNTSSENFGVSTLYKATAAIASGSAIVVGTNCEASKIVDDIALLSSNINTLNESLDELYVTDNLQDAALWENDALNVGDGSTFHSDMRIVTKDWIPVIKGSTLTILNSYRFSYTVNSEPTVGTAYRLESKTLGQMVQTVTISHSGYIRISIAPPSDTSVDVSIRSNLEANILSNILSSRLDVVSENIKNLDGRLEKTQSDVEVVNNRINDVIKSSINLIDTDRNTKDYYVNKNTGEVVTYAVWDVSDYIPVKQAEYVAIVKRSNRWEYSPTIYMAFYDANKHYTHGISVFPSAPYMQAVSGDAYARISYGRTTNPDIMFGTREDLEGYVGTSKDRVPAGNYIENDLNYKKLEPLLVRIVMPDKVVALVDEQFDIHYDNVLCYGNIKTIPYKEMFGSAFTSMENMARAQVATAGEGNNVLRLYSSVLSAITSQQLPSTVLKKVFVFKTIEKTSGAGITRNVLLIGDSTTAPGIYARELKALFEAETEPMNIRLLGTLGNGGAEVGAETGYHEGHGGYSCKTYCTTAYHNGYNNHFYNPTTQAFDFSYYMTYTGFTNIADVFIVMGINDVAAMEDYDEMMTYFRQMVTSIRSANSFDGQPARVFIALCIPPAEYKYSDINNNSQRSKTRRLLLHERLIEEWGNRESEGFYIVPLNLSIDPEHDFKTEQRARSFRDQTMVTYCTDNIHPSTIAYNKMADRMRTYIKYAEI